MTPTFNEWKMRWSWSSGATSCFSVYFFLLFYFSVCLRKSNTNSTCTTCIYSVSETWMWMQSNSLEIIFVLCGTIYNEYIFLYIIRNKFVSQQKLNALNHIATQRLCVCVCFSSLASSRSFFFFQSFDSPSPCYYLYGISHARSRYEEMKSWHHMSEQNFSNWSMVFYFLSTFSIS